MAPFNTKYTPTAATINHLESTHIYSKRHVRLSTLVLLPRVSQHLIQQGKVNHQLERTTSNEWYRIVSDDKGNRFEGITQEERSQQHHWKAFSVAILIILNELRQAERGLDHQCSESHHLDKEGTQKHQNTRAQSNHANKHDDKRGIRLQIGPIPKFVPRETIGRKQGSRPLLTIRRISTTNVKHDELGQDHDQALEQKNRIESSTKPIEHPQNVGDHENERYSLTEGLTAPLLTNHAILIDVADHGAEHHGEIHSQWEQLSPHVFFCVCLVWQRQVGFCFLFFDRGELFRQEKIANTTKMCLQIQVGVLLLGDNLDIGQLLGSIVQCLLLLCWKPAFWLEQLLFRIV